MSDNDKTPSESVWPESEPRRPPPGFVSAEEDMLYDFEEMDRLEAGLLTPRNVDSIRLVAKMCEEQGRSVDVDSLARMYAVADRSEVARVIEELGTYGTDGPTIG